MLEEMSNGRFVDVSALRRRWKWRRAFAPVVRTGHGGFGKALIEGSARSQGGGAKRSVDQTGVSWAMSLPLEEVDTSRSTPEGVTRTAIPVSTTESLRLVDRSLSGFHVLVVERFDIIACLDDAGAEVTHPVGTVPAALRAIEAKNFGVVLLDGNLGGKSVEPVARELLRGKIPSRAGPLQRASLRALKGSREGESNRN